MVGVLFRKEQYPKKKDVKKAEDSEVEVKLERAKLKELALERLRLKKLKMARLASLETVKSLGDVGESEI